MELHKNFVPLKFVRIITYNNSGSILTGDCRIVKNMLKYYLRRN